MHPTFDVAVIGGGINGCGVVADAALRGLSVVLCEQDDIASKTSSSSTKLIHGGLRYLEQYDFSMVKRALDERHRLATLAPHLVRPQTFILPWKKGLRPHWMLNIGLFLYDHLSRKNHLPKTQRIDRQHQPTFFEPLNDEFSKGFLFYDCATEDARLTLANALQAKVHGADIRTRTSLIQAEAEGNIWSLTLQHNGKASQIQAKSVINATGPWVESVNRLLNIPSTHAMSLVKGSHFIVPALYPGKEAYFLQHTDQRVIFVIPYHGHTLIGTTDVAFSGDPHHLTIEPQEIDYLCNVVNHYFKKSLRPDDILHTWSGVRPLLAKDGKNLKALSRDYAYTYTQHPAPAVSIYGGKITTYRQLSQKVVDQLHPVFPTLPVSKTAITPLPGAEYEGMTFAEYETKAPQKYPWLPKPILTHYLKNYGTRMENLLAHCQNLSDLGQSFSNTLYQREVDHLLQEEWAETVDDVLWRRTKLGFEVDGKGYALLDQYIRTAAGR